MSAVFEYWPALIDGLITTIWVAVTSILGSAVVSLMLGTLRISRKRSVRIIASFLIEVFRGASALVFLFWVFYALPLLPGMPRLSPMGKA
jgi:polar amino acid transport system permease protein